jgi:hypothetical protein
LDWAGFEPAIFRLRIERPYQSGLPARVITWIALYKYV